MDLESELSHCNSKQEAYFSPRREEPRLGRESVSPRSSPPLKPLSRRLPLAVTTRARRRRSLGFTLIEILAVTVIIGILSGIAVPKYHEMVDRAKVAKAIGDLKAITTDLLSLDSLPPSLAAINRQNMLDPWGHPYVYLKFVKKNSNAPPAGARKDRFLVPINSDFDLYSMGKDGQSVAPLTAAKSRDDVIVANDGGFTGLAKNY